MYTLGQGHNSIVIELFISMHRFSIHVYIVEPTYFLSGLSSGHTIFHLCLTMQWGQLNNSISVQMCQCTNV